tara:strand:- start:84 stop:698 length:615 start_codon:yes stop_codon:yes gene_type:complete
MIPRNLDRLHRQKITYRRDPTDRPDFENHQYMFFEDGTYQAYDLFKSKAKINTYRSLKWHLLVIWYLNPQMNPEEFNDLSKFIADKENGFTTFSITDNALERIIHDVHMCDLDEPPKNKLRKVIFKMGSGLDKFAKLSIVGKLIGTAKRIHADDIYECMIELNDMSKKITVSGIAKILNCSTRTIHRNMCDELRREKELLNRNV